MAGICGTDLELTRGYMGFRGVPGHEFVGVVEKSADPELVGRRVAGEINGACGRCDFCRRDLGRHCPNRTVLGILGRDGAFADYLTLPDSCLVPIPDPMTDEQAVFIEPVAAAYEILEQTRLPLEHTQLPHDWGDIIILGDGRLAALVAMVLSAEGYPVEISGHHKEKLQQIVTINPDLIVVPIPIERPLNDAYKAVIDCTGNASGFSRALELVRPRGIIILKTTAATANPINLAPVVVNEITVLGSRCGRFAPAVAALAKCLIDPRPLISARYPLDDALAALAAARDPLNFKVLLKIS
jgi:threonine dehydrogenase-like Zn-dependent dehydrogenase